MLGYKSQGSRKLEPWADISERLRRTEPNSILINDVIDDN